MWMALWMFVQDRSGCIQLYCYQMYFIQPNMYSISLKRLDQCDRISMQCSKVWVSVSFEIVHSHQEYMLLAQIAVYYLVVYMRMTIISTAWIEPFQQGQ